MRPHHTKEATQHASPSLLIPSTIPPRLSHPNANRKTVQTQKQAVPNARTWDGETLGDTIPTKKQKKELAANINSKTDHDKTVFTLTTNQ
jgi:hypothetical protein